jgi:hypothetical protein
MASCSQVQPQYGGQPAAFKYQFFQMIDFSNYSFIVILEGIFFYSGWFIKSFKMPIVAIVFVLATIESSCCGH